MKVRIGRDFFDKKNDTVYTNGEIADVNKETALWMVRNSLGYIIPNVRVGRPVSIGKKETEKTKAIEESQKDKMMRKDNIKNK
jgi:hypothetical protein